MKNALIEAVENEVLTWDGVFRKRDEDGIGGIGVTGYRYGSPETGGPQLGHIHDDGRADMTFSESDYEATIASEKAEPHIFRNTITYELQTEDDVPKVLELLRINYERLKDEAR